MASKDTMITDLAEDVGDKAKRTSRTVGEKASDVMVEMKGEAADIAASAGKSAKSAASSGKDYAAEAVHGLADAARQMASKLDDGKTEGGNAKAAEFARKAADSMDKFSSKMRNKNVDEIAEDARSVVRQNPAIAVGAAAIIGFALARFLKGNGDD